MGMLDPAAVAQVRCGRKKVVNELQGLIFVVSISL